MPIKFPKKRTKKERESGGRWVFVPEKDLTPEQIADNLEADKDEVMNMLMVHRDPNNPFAVVDEFHDYFPGEQEVPEEGAWILVKELPGMEYMVPPLSIWFATPWPQDSGRHPVHRVKIITPKGEIGVYPHEYSKVKDPGKYFEFVGDGMSVKFFGNEEGVPRDKLFYIRSRGISKKDAMLMLIGSIMAHGVMWLETDEEVCKQFGYKWPPKERLATDGSVTPPPDKRRAVPAGSGGSPECSTGDPGQAGSGESLHGTHEQTEWGLGKSTNPGGGTEGKPEVPHKAGRKQ